MTIDTLEYVKKLEAAGVDRKAAEAHAEALRASIEDELATKADILRLENTTKGEIHRLETSVHRLEAKLEGKISEFKTELEGKLSGLEGRFADFKAEMLKYMIAQTFLIVGVVFALLRFVR
jgi:chromosome segregation ATPase